MFQHLIDERESGVGTLLQRSNLINVTVRVAFRYWVNYALAVIALALLSDCALLTISDCARLTISDCARLTISDSARLTISDCAHSAKAAHFGHNRLDNSSMHTTHFFKICGLGSSSYLLSMDIIKGNNGKKHNFISDMLISVSTLQCIACILAIRKFNIFSISIMIIL